MATVRVIFSHVKITRSFHVFTKTSCIRTKAHFVFHWFLYNKVIYFDFI